MWLEVAIAAVCIYLIYLIQQLYRQKLIDGIQSKAVLITGTDSGFGRKLAEDLDKDGVKVFAGCYTSSGAESLSKVCSDRMRIFRLDVTSEESLLQAKQFVQNDLGPKGELWGLVNNAGIACGEFIHISTLKDFRNVMDVNFFGVINTTETFLPLIKKSKGRIVNVISIMGRMTLVFEPYTCSKFALVPYTDGLRRCMNDYGVYVASIEPSGFRTAIIDQDRIMAQMEKEWAELPTALKEEYGEDFFEAAKRDISFGFKCILPLIRWNHLGMVTEAMHHALFAKHPKSRYLCGWDAWLSYPYSILLPNWLVDFIYAVSMSHSRLLRRKMADKFAK